MHYGWKKLKRLLFNNVYKMADDDDDEIQKTVASFFSKVNYTLYITNTVLIKIKRS